MATAVVMPKQGQSVESCIIVGWKKEVGETVEAGEVLCEVETDKALLEVESPAAGTLLALFFAAGDEVPVLTNIAAIGEPGENVDDLRPEGAIGAADAKRAASPVAEKPAAANGQAAGEVAPAVAVESAEPAHLGVSPRARKLAHQKMIDLMALSGSGPGGRIIERDVQADLAAQPAMTPLAKTMVERGGFQAPARGSGVSGRVTSEDLIAPAAPEPQRAAPAPAAEEVTVIPVKGVRRVIAARMLESLQTTAQLTLNASAEARALQAYRQRLKASPEALGLQSVTINDLILFAVTRILPQYPALNALFTGEQIEQHHKVHLGFAVDTPRGLMVPVLKGANRLSLKQIAQESKRLAAACLDSSITADEMSGGTFTVTNLGSFGIESFTPVLNPPQVGILGVGNINLKPVQNGDQVEFIPHLGLSLTINHQAVDGAPAARFLQALAQGLAQFELLLAG